ncbi:MAG: RHS repeat-associated core domain-containing protein [Parachlamydiaceae bacterium]
MHYCIFVISYLFFSINVISNEIGTLPHSSPDQLVSLTQEVDKIGGVISPLSGQPVLRQTDLVAKGAQDIVLRRVFISQYHDWYGSQSLLMSKGLIPHQQVVDSGWVIFPHTALDHVTIVERKHHQNFTVKNEARIVDPSGATLTFTLNSNKGAQLINKPYGICNSGLPNEMPNGQYDLRNTKIEKSGTKIIVTSPQGSVYHYSSRSISVFESEKKHTITQRTRYLLSKEILPNGKVLRYCYNKNKELIRIESTDPKERYVYAAIDIDSSAHQPSSKFSSNTGKSATYQQQPKRNRFQPDKSKGFSDEDNRALNLLSITSAETPYYSKENISFANALLDSYSAQRKQFTCQYAESGTHLSSNKKVSQLLLPDETKNFLPVHELSYQPPLVGKQAGSTTVKNIDGTSIKYEYSSTLLLTAVNHYDAKSVLKKKKQFTWTDNHWLSSVVVQDGNGCLLYKKTYQYDAYGNPVHETLHGDLTGKGVQESLTTKRQFSDDGRHLLLKEENDEGKIVSFLYLPNTNLITAHFTQEQDRILQREFFEYDDSNNLIKKIKDNGSSKDINDLSSVTQRNVVYYQLRNEAPFLHMPEWIEEKFLDNGSEQLLKKSHLSYDIHGNACEETVYDADGNFAYTINKTYNDRGNLLSISNAIGQQTFFEYDDKGRRISSTNFSGNIHTKTEYDQRDNLTKIKEIGVDNVIHTTSFSYDLNDHLVREINPFQNITDYSYDPLSHKVTKTCFSSILNLKGKAVSVSTTSRYDAFGREIFKRDANGNITTFRYGAYLSPVEIVYADNSRETFRYTRSGLLESHINQEGLKTSYKYDALGRVTIKSFSAHEGEIAKETFVYDGFNRVEMKDSEGNRTSYRYDGAGRIISETTAQHVTRYSYDTLGRISITTEENGTNTLLTHYKHDLLDRLLEKQCTDTDGHLLSTIAYSYDTDGNIATITRNINGNDAIETFVYDSFQRQIESVDAVGNRTGTTYNENTLNSLGQKVLQTTIVDPKNRTTIKTEDPYGRLATEEIIGPDGTDLSKLEMTYDKNGNQIRKRNIIYQDGHFQRTLETTCTYNPFNKIKSVVRAANTSSSRTTRYTYDPSGNVATKTKPDGIVLSYRYHPLGYLKTVSSSDHQLHLTYDYNLLGDILKATDTINNISIERDVDPQGNILSEELSTGLAIEKTYDAFDRPLSVVLPDHSRIIYTYDPLFLRSVSRTSSSGEILYTHEYTNYDSSGYLKTENLIDSLGTVTHTTDLKGRKTGIRSPYFTQNCTYDEVDNLMASATNRVEEHYTYDGLNQLSSDSDGTYQHDSNYNRVKETDSTWKSNELDELLSTEKIECTYDLNGNLLSKETPTETLALTYDPLDRLIRVVTTQNIVEMSYDPLGRRVSKTVHNKSNSDKTIENYLFDGNNDIGAFIPEGKAKQLRVLGLTYYENAPSTVAVELDGEVFASIQDYQGNIRHLISTSQRESIAQYDFTAFGRSKKIAEKFFNPWRYASKRLDPETNLINFGKRYYDADLSRWITTDPAGFIDTMNLYAYVRNNPFRYIDPDGRHPALLIVFALEIAFDCTITFMTVEAIAGTVIGALIGIGVYQINTALEENKNVGTATESAGEGASEDAEAKEKKRRKPSDVYAPPRPLPMTKPGGIPIPDTDAPHTQLGTKNGSKGSYPQAREFDANGKPVRTIDFTDHGRPHNHTNPHQHRNIPNSTGGTPNRDKPEPVPEWSYK